MLIQYFKQFYKCHMKISKNFEFRFKFICKLTMLRLEFLSLMIPREKETSKNRVNQFFAIWRSLKI